MTIANVQCVTIREQENKSVGKHLFKFSYFK